MSVATCRNCRIIGERIPGCKDCEITRLQAALAKAQRERDKLQERIGYDNAPATMFQNITQERDNLAAAIERLHTAVCQAVTLMNVGDNRPAHTLLRQVLIAHADAALRAPVEQEKPK